ncbi:MAG: hypothetical protein HKM04_04990 [Legionellales bacterium]|nr:hypothetical protein [Legionellales bacterium]
MKSTEWELFSQVAQAYANDNIDIADEFSSYVNNIEKLKLSNFLICALEYSIENQNRHLAKITMEKMASFRNESDFILFHDDVILELLQKYKNWTFKDAVVSERENHDAILTQVLLNRFLAKQTNLIQISSNEYKKMLPDIFEAFIVDPKKSFFSMTLYLNYLVSVLTALYAKSRKNLYEFSIITYKSAIYFSSLAEEYINRTSILNTALFTFLKVWVTLYHALLNQEPFQILEEDFDGLIKEHFIEVLEALWQKKQGCHVDVVSKIKQLSETRLEFAMCFLTLEQRVNYIEGDKKSDFFMMAIRHIPVYMFTNFKLFNTVYEIMEPGPKFSIHSGIQSASDSSNISDQETKFFFLTNQVKGFEAIPRDGNCFFRAVLASLGENQEEHTELRAQAINYMVANAENLVFYFDNDYEKLTQYITEMAATDAWAGDIILNVVANIKNCRIVIQDLKKEAGEIVPIYQPIVPIADGYWNKEITLVRVNNNHYHAIAPRTMQMQVNENPANVQAALFANRRVLNNNNHSIQNNNFQNNNMGI